MTDDTRLSPSDLTVEQIYGILNSYGSSFKRTVKSIYLGAFASKESFDQNDVSEAKLYLDTGVDYLQFIRSFITSTLGKDHSGIIEAKDGSGLTIDLKDDSNKNRILEAISMIDGLGSSELGLIKIIDPETLEALNKEIQNKVKKVEEFYSSALLPFINYIVNKSEEIIALFLKSKITSIFDANKEKRANSDKIINGIPYRELISELSKLK